MRSSRQLQINNKTFLGRYWTELTVLRRYVPSDLGVSVLSFGCSTGEELLTLRTLFPGARLCGCDVDWNNLQAARALLGDRAEVFASTDKALIAHGPYDIIVCNSVLLVTGDGLPGRAGIAPALWLDLVALMDSVLRPGGILQIINTNIPFRLHPVALDYQVLDSPLILGPNFVDLFDLAGHRMCAGEGGAGWSALLHRHWAEEAWPAMKPGDLTNVHFRKPGGDAIVAVADERIPHLAAARAWAEGTMSYRTPATDDPRASTFTEVDVRWQTVGVDAVRLDRVARRIWFDGSIVQERHAGADLIGRAAAVFIESSTGRRSSAMAMGDLLAPAPVRSAAF